MSVLFGDGAAAVVLGEAREQRSGIKSGILGFELHAEGAHAEKLCMAFPGTKEEHLIKNRLLAEDLVYPRMEGKIVFKHAVHRLPEVISSLCKTHQVSISDVDLFVLHQANRRINEAAAAHLGIDEGKVHHTIEQYGNTSAASIPIGLSDAFEQGRIKQGSLVCLAGFGSGFTWGACLVRW